MNAGDLSIENGRQSERTTMAWQRTALGLGGVSALLLHDAAGDLTASAPGAAGLVAALVVLVHADTHHRHGDASPEHAPMGIRAVRVMAILTVLLSLLAALVVLRPGG